MKLVLKQCVLVFFSCVLLGCTTPGEPSADASLDDNRGGHDCISQSSIRDYQVLNDRNLVVTAGVKRKYHMVLSRPAFGLRSTWQIGFRAMSQRICGGTADLVYSDGIMGAESIRVRSIRELNPEELDDLLVQFGKKEPDIEQAPAQDEVKGAEVEELD